MNHRRDFLKLALLGTIPSAVLSACGGGDSSTSTTGPVGPIGRSGVVVDNMDSSVRPQDDLFRYANGRWLDRTEIPADNASWGTFDEVNQRTLDQLHAILDESRAHAPAPGSAERIAGDFYASFMDEATIERRGVAVIATDLQRVDGVRSASDIVRMIVDCQRMGVPAPLELNVYPDGHDTSRYVAVLGQSGLSLPGASHYLEASSAPIVERYRRHVAQVMGMAGLADAAAQADAVVAFETRLAGLQWSPQDSGDAVKTYNRRAVARLKSSMDRFDWDVFMEATGLTSRISFFVVLQPSYLEGLNDLLDDADLPLWRSYFRWQILRTASQYMGERFSAESFAFFGTALTGAQTQPPRWKRAVNILNGLMGDSLGQAYVHKHFDPAALARIEALVARVREAYGQAIEGSEWLGEAARRRALLKLRNMSVKVGYPKTWKDYSGAGILPDDLWGNVVRAQRLRYERDLARVGQPVDRDEWLLSPQTVNAYYTRLGNEIVFPAAILQVPFFDAEADDAANYGAIGSIIGHEISHAFDESGSRFDEFGALSSWWSDKERAAYEGLIGGLVRQYERFAPLPGHFVNGKLTLDENIADNVGLQIAFRAYQQALGRTTARTDDLAAEPTPGPVMDGYTGIQRFYLSYANAFRTKTRDAEVLRRLERDPHSPPEVRVNAGICNQAGFHTAFAVKPSDRLFLAPEQRVVLWQALGD
jgi:predicted metalloendopeptidase